MNRMHTMHVSTPNIPLNRWDEFTMMAGYSSACTPTWTLSRTPFKVWHGKKPDLSHLCEIGLHAFALILKHNPKVYKCSFKCVLVGYSPHSKAYCLFHPSTHHLFESFHVKFIEWKDNVSHCNKDMGFYPSSILFIFHYLAFVSHDSFPYLSVGSHVTIILLTPLPPLHLLLSGHIVSQLISIGKWYCVYQVTDTVTPRGQVSAQLIRADLIRSAVISLPASVSNLLRIS